MIAGAFVHLCWPSGAVLHTNQLYFGQKLLVHPLSSRGRERLWIGRENLKSGKEKN